MQEKNYSEPFSHFSEWFDKAQKSHPVPQNKAMSLATVDSAGKPSVRVVLLKEFDERGFVFYTNTTSKKAADLSNNPHAALCFYWPAMLKQVTVIGAVTQVSEAEAEAYFATRPKGSQLAAWSSQQSAVLESRKVLLQKYNMLKKEYANKSVPRPPYWSGYRLKPESFEFWIAHIYRLNERLRYRREGTGWKKELLY
ncbi:MAG: pyridoxamine 5'-phosphate oxidase, partial [bacterium]